LINLVECENERGNIWGFLFGSVFQIYCAKLSNSLYKKDYTLKTKGEIKSRKDFPGKTRPSPPGFRTNLHSANGGIVFFQKPCFPVFTFLLDKLSLFFFSFLFWNVWCGIAEEPENQGRTINFW